MMLVTYQEEIVLNEVVLERLNRKRSISQASDESMLSMVSPSFLNVWALQDVFDKAATDLGNLAKCLKSGLETYGGKGNVYVE